jgi:hypothetical protein
MANFIVGQGVTWRSQAQGSTTTKTGVIVEVVPPNVRPDTTGRPGLNGCGSGRNHESYVIEVPQGLKAAAKHYWPVVSILRHAPLTEGPAERQD